jgi:hypothetical protein
VSVKHPTRELQIRTSHKRFGESRCYRISTKSLTRLAEDKEGPVALLRKQPFLVVQYG